MCEIFTVDISTVHAHTNHYGCLWSFFDNAFWFSKFYFRQFDPNLRSIAFNFLVKSGVGRIWTKIKKVPSMGVVLEVSIKIHLDPLTYKIS